jgi:hypothetical protein
MMLHLALPKVFTMFLSVFIFSTFTQIFPCTVAVVSGKVTHDNRPLMWKNRDTPDFPDNKILFFKGKRYNFIAMVNALEEKPESVWAGINNAGLAIMNSSSKDLVTDENDLSDNGRIMKIALGTCADVSDFENLLQRTNGRRRVGANYGVIDAKGSACLFETESFSFTKFDANDPHIAPQGYIIRTNHAFTAPVQDTGAGYIRFERALQLFQAAASGQHLNTRFILQEASRDLVNDKLRSHPLAVNASSSLPSSLFVNTNDTINRNTTVSVALFHGVSSPERAYLSTMWVMLGQPVCAVAVPLWTEAGEIPCELTGARTAPLCDFSRALASYLYPDKRGHMNQYLSVTRLLGYRGDGILNRLLKIEDHVFTEAEKRIKQWLRERPERQKMLAFEKEISSRVYASLQQLFPDFPARKDCPPHNESLHSYWRLIPD